MWKLLDIEYVCQGTDRDIYLVRMPCLSIPLCDLGCLLKEAGGWAEQAHLVQVEIKPTRRGIIISGLKPLEPTRDNLVTVLIMPGVQPSLANNRCILITYKGGRGTCPIR